METLIDQAPLDDAITKLRALGSNSGNDEEPPSQQAVVRATEWVTCLYQEISDSGSRWIAPHITATPDGEVVLEWWLREKTLTAFFKLDSSNYLATWGTNIMDDMTDGDLLSEKQRRDLWQWFIG